MKQYIGTKIIEAEPAYRCMDGQGRVTITDDPSEAFPNFPSVEEIGRASCRERVYVLV